MESYSNYNLDDILVRTFMMPAVMPKDKINMINMPNNTLSILLIKIIVRLITLNF